MEEQLDHLLRPSWTFGRHLNAIANICSLNSGLDVVEDVNGIHFLLLVIYPVLSSVLRE